MGCWFTCSKDEGERDDRRKMMRERSALNERDLSKQQQKT